MNSIWLSTQSLPLEVKLSICSCTCVKFALTTVVRSFISHQRLKQLIAFHTSFACSNLSLNRSGSSKVVSACVWLRRSLVSREVAYFVNATKSAVKLLGIIRSTVHSPHKPFDNMVTSRSISSCSFRRFGCGGDEILRWRAYMWCKESSKL